MKKQKEDKIAKKIINGFVCIGCIILFILILPIAILSVVLAIIVFDSEKTEPKTDDELVREWREKEKKLYEESIQL